MNGRSRESPRDPAAGGDHRDNCGADRGSGSAGLGPGRARMARLRRRPRQLPVRRRDPDHQGQRGRLQVAWTYPAGQTDFNPLVVRGVVYGRGPNDSFVALDAATGKQIWIHEGVQGFTNRGVNYWESKDGRSRRLIFSTNNLLQEIDAQTGESISSFGVNGRVDLRVGLDRDPSTINQQIAHARPGLREPAHHGLGDQPGVRVGARRHPRVRRAHRGAGLDVSHRAAAGRVRLRDLADGRVEDGRRRQQLGRAVDRREARHRLRPDRQRRSTTSTAALRKGANLFGDCLIALDARTGKRLWHFQTVHHDIWDLDNNSAPQLTTIRRNGRSIDVVAMASKTGYLYVFDRVTGSRSGRSRNGPCRRRRTVPGESLSPTQPFPTNPPPFSRQKFTVDDLNPYILTPEEREQFRQRILKARNDGPFTPIGFDEVIHMPGNQGGSNWGSTAAQSDRRQRVRHRLQRAGAPPPAEARRHAPRRARRPAGGRRPKDDT